MAEKNLKQNATGETPKAEIVKPSVEKPAVMDGTVSTYKKADILRIDTQDIECDEKNYVDQFFRSWVIPRSDVFISTENSRPYVTIQNSDDVVLTYPMNSPKVCSLWKSLIRRVILLIEPLSSLLQGGWPGKHTARISATDRSCALVLTPRAT